MYCPSCGVEQSEEASYCSECGAELSASPKQFESNEATNGGTATASGATGGGTQQTGGQQATTGAAGAANSTSSGWATWRKIAAVSGGAAAVSLFLPWVEAVAGGITANGISTEIGVVILVAAIVGAVPPLLSWGRGWGWLSMIISGLAGLGVAGLAFFTMAYTSETVSTARIVIDGQAVPVAAVEPTVGIYVAIAGGLGLLVSAIAGIVATLLN